MKLVVAGQIECVQRIVVELDGSYADNFRRKSRVQGVEIVNGSGEGMGLTYTDTKVGEVCDQHLLAAPAGPQG